MSNPSHTTPIQILLVEDNPGDVDLTKISLRKLKIANELTVAKDGAEALEILQREDSEPPDLILLDLNLPRKDGREVLAVIKEHPMLRRIPVVVLTSSKAEQDILKSYDLHANSYITKPVGFEEFTRVVQTIEDFWFTVVRLPRGA